MAVSSRSGGSVTQDDPYAGALAPRQPRDAAFLLDVAPAGKLFHLFQFCPATDAMRQVSLSIQALYFEAA
jgi:hypothetical protein